MYTRRKFVHRSMRKRMETFVAFAFIGVMGCLEVIVLIALAHRA